MTASMRQDLTATDRAMAHNQPRMIRGRRIRSREGQMTQKRIDQNFRKKETGRETQAHLADLAWAQAWMLIMTHIF